MTATRAAGDATPGLHRPPVFPTPANPVRDVLDRTEEIVMSHIVVPHIVPRNLALPFLLAAALPLLSACSAARPDPVASPRLDSGVSSSSGGGTQTLGGSPSVGVTTRTGR